MYRAWLACLVVACSGDSQLAVDAAPASDATSVDASVVPACATPYAFDADEVFGLAVNGTELVISTATAGGFALLALATSDGSVTTLASGNERYPVATRAGVAFYAVNASGTYTIHQRTGGNDAVLASIASTAPVEIGASATDVYVLAQEPNTSRVWRVARTGGSPVEVMTFASPASNLHVGTTNVSVFSASATHVMTQPGPATPTSYNQGFANIFSGDLGFARRGGMITQNTGWWGVFELFPTFSMVVMSQTYMGLPPPPSIITADDRYLYVGGAFHTSGPPWTSAAVVACMPSNVFDDTSHYRTYKVSDGKYVAVVAARPL